MRLRLFSALGAIAMIASLWAVSQAAQGARVLVSPASSSIAPDQTVVIEVWVRDVADLYGVDFSISFDPTLLHVEDANPAKLGVQIEPGEFLGAAQLFEARNLADNDAGTITYTAVLKNPSPAVSGSGVVARITLRGRSGGTSAVVFTRALLGNQRAESIPASVMGGTVLVGGPTATVAPSATPTATRTRTRTPTGVPSPTPTPALEEVALGQAARDLGWPSDVMRQPPLFKIQFIAAAGHTSEAWMQRYARPDVAHAALLQQRDALVNGGWDVHPLLFHGHEAYQASHALNAASEDVPLSERVLAFQGGFYLVGVSSFDDTSYAVAPDPETVGEALYQMGLDYYLFGDVVPSAFLPVLIRDIPPTPTPTATASPTPTATPTETEVFTPSPTPTGDWTPEPTFTPTATPTVTETPLPTASPTATATPTATLPPTITPTPTVSPTPGGPVTQLILNPGFETNATWNILETAYPAGYSVSRAHSGRRSMRLGIDTGANLLSYSSVQQSVTIPAGVVQANLSFFYWPVSAQADGDRIYLIILRASDNVTLQSYLWTDQNQSWDWRQVDLRAFAGQRIILRFGVMNDGLGSMLAVYLDDVEVGVR